MSIEALVKAVSPPLSPIAGGENLAWGPVEAELKVILPPDYKAYVARFGVGRLNDYFHPLNPFTPNPHLNLIRHLETLYEAERGLLLNHPEDSQLFPPFPLHPESPGLLPWGVTDNGEELFWHTVGVSEHWPVVVYSGRQEKYETFPMSMSRFLAAVLTGELVSRLFPDDLCGTQITFEQ